MVMITMNDNDNKNFKKRFQKRKIQKTGFQFYDLLA